MEEYVNTERFSRHKRHRAHNPNREQIIVTEVATSYNSLSSLASLTLILLTWRIWCDPNNASKQQMGFNSVFKGLSVALFCNDRCYTQIKIFV